MAAHLRTIFRPTCSWSGCDSYATKTLHNTWNAAINHYCGKHATRALRDYRSIHSESMEDDDERESYS